MAENDGSANLASSLSARFRRKERVARGEDVPDTREEELAQQSEVVAPEDAESEEDAALDDAALLEKYGVENPETIEDETQLENVLNGGFPDRIRQMALRRMWRLNPFFGVVDEMVEYGENYTDAATVIDGMTTAYEVGKGYLKQALDATEKVESAVEKAMPSDGAIKASDTAAGKTDGLESDDNLEVEGGQANEAGATASSDDDTKDLAVSTDDVAGSGVSEAEASVSSDETGSVAGDDELTETRSRPRRMQFRKGS